MSTNKEALQAARDRYKEIYGTEPAQTLGLAQLAKKIADSAGTAGAGSDGEQPNAGSGTPPADEGNKPPIPPEAGDNNPPSGDNNPLPNPPVENTGANKPEDNAGTGDVKPNTKKNQKAITKEDLSTTEIRITNGKITKTYSKFAWDNFLSKAAGKWRVVADVPPELKTLVK